MYFGVLKVCRKLTAYALLLGLLAGGFLLISTPVNATAGVNQQINFQGRLLNAQGAVAPDGFYNLQFKIYKGGDGLTVASTGTPVGTAAWTESWLNNNSKGVVVRNGFMSVQLGSVNPFGSSIDWNDDTLWLSVTIGNVNLTCTPFASCSPDTEMVPMKRMSASPYALNSGLLGGLTSAQFLQIAQGVQTDASTNTSSIYINKTGTGNLTTLQSGGNDAFVISNSGDINFGANANHTVSVVTAATNTAGKSLTMAGGAAGTGAAALAGGDLVLQGGAAGGTNGNGGNVTIDAGLKNGSGADGTISIGNSRASTIQIGNATLATGTQTINIGNANTAGGTTNVTVGNGGTATAGTTTMQAKSNVIISTNSVVRATFDTTNDLYLGNGTIAAAPNDFTVIGTASSTTAVAGGSINVQGGNATVGNANGGNIAINSGTLFGSGTDGTVSVGNLHARTIQIGNATLDAGIQDINIGNGNTAGGTTNVAIGAGSTATGGTTDIKSKGAMTLNSGSTVGITSATNTSLTATAGTMTISSSGNSSIGATAGTFATSSSGNTTITSTAGTVGLVSNGATTFTTNGAVRGTFDSASYGLYLGNGVTGAVNPFTLSATGGSAGLAGSAMTVQGGIGANGFAGGALTLAGGAGTGTGVGGALSLQGGTSGSSTIGAINIGTTSASTISMGNSATTSISIGNNAVAAGTQTINIGNTALGANTQTINLGYSNTANGTTNVAIGAGSTATGGTTDVRSKGAMTFNSGSTVGITSATNTTVTATAGTIALSSSGNTTVTSTAGTVGIVSNGATTFTTNSAVRGTFDSASNALYLGLGITGALNPFTVAATGGTAGVAGSALTVAGGIGGSSSVGGALNLQGGTGGSTSGAGGAVSVQGGNATAGASNGGDLSLNAGTKFGGGVDGNINIGNLNTNTIQIGNTAPTATQTINIGGSTTTGTTNVTIGSSNSSTAGTTAIQSKGNITISTAGVARGTFDNAGNLYLGNGVTAGAPANFTINGTGSTTTAVAGGTVTIQGGNATVGNAAGGVISLAGGTGIGSGNGGNLNLSGGTAGATGANGLVVMTTPTFSTTANDANCYTGGALVAASCTITAASVNNSSAILAGFSATSQTATLPDPTIATAGRVIYITAANTSKDFTLSVNGGGIGNTIAMRQNTTATMIWNGVDWTAAGASSSTTLQSAYDNTLTTAGGAELVLSNSANANGLTIRDNATTPINGALLEVQTSTAGQLFSVNNNTTEYAKDGGAETGGGTSDATDATFPATTWTQTAAGSTVSRTTTTINANAQISTGMASVSVVTTGTANAGAINRLSTTLTQNMRYNVSFAAKLLSTSNSFQDLAVYYSANGSTLTTQCVNYSSQTIPVSAWSKINCTVSIPSGATSSNSIIIVQTGATAHTFYIDNLSVSLSADVNYATDGGVDNSGAFATNWPAVGTSTVSADATVGNDRNTSAKVIAGTTAGNGIRNLLSITPFSGGTLYRITAYATTTTAFTDFTIRYSPNAGTNFIACKDYNTQTVTVSATSFTKITCYITTDNTAVTTPYIYFTQTAAPGASRTFYVDTFSMNLSSSTVPNVQIGGGLAGSPLTLFTVDRGASAPIAANNDALLGSMYYDTTLGKLQCYEADGWGACGSSPDNVITISPEYTNAVLHGTGVGTMTSDLCSDTLNINDGSSSQPTICGTNETYNFYKWTSPQASAQTYSIYVTYQLPSTFKSFASGQTSLMGRTDNGPSSGTGTVQYSIYRNTSGSVLTQCGSAIIVSTGTKSSWQIGVTTGSDGAADPSACGFNAGDSIVFKIDTIANQNANAYVGNLNFIYTNK